MKHACKLALLHVHNLCIVLQPVYCTTTMLTLVNIFFYCNTDQLRFPQRSLQQVRDSSCMPHPVSIRAGPDLLLQHRRSRPSEGRTGQDPVHLRCPGERSVRFRRRNQGVVRGACQYYCNSSCNRGAISTTTTTTQGLAQHHHCPCRVSRYQQAHRSLCHHRRRRHHHRCNTRGGADFWSVAV